MATRPDPFASALQTLRSAHRERRERRLTPVAPEPPRDSDPQAGEALPSHEALAQSGERDAALPTAAAAWAWTEGDSDDGAGGRR